MENSEFFNNFSFKPKELKIDFSSVESFKRSIDEMCSTIKFSIQETHKEVDEGINKYFYK